ncbi:M48 family metallopeptidase [Patescibacteria group bacterium]|nr:M48 family metallopeptidase [Patescibacteria group bacterium]MBU1721699.1 M48 family metallopeptidase [Patescibacteria group bacterium]MBU1901452.1 M48 family metallopeptidase [Patescibacteria group bacterium]
MQDAPARSWGSYPAYKGRALKHVRDLVQEWNALYGFEYHQIRVKDMHTQWGSCSSDRRLNFNYRLYFLPKHLADYIVVHELCHLAEMNHSHKFWRLVAQQIPDYKKRRQELKRILL